MTLSPKSIRARYPECYCFTLGFEGGYVDHPEDPGGCTNKGVTLGTLKSWRGDDSLTCEDVKTLTDKEAAEIYRDRYWMMVWGDDLPIGLNLQVWDWGVNSGPSRAISALQKLSGSAQDGIMGPNTLDAARNWFSRLGADNALDAYHLERQRFYESLSTFSTFGAGWTRRNTECRDLSKELSAKGPAFPFLDGDHRPNYIALLVQLQAAVEAQGMAIDDLETRVSDMETNFPD